MINKKRWIILSTLKLCVPDLVVVQITKPSTARSIKILSNRNCWEKPQLFWVATLPLWVIAAALG